MYIDDIIVYVKLFDQNIDRLNASFKNFEELKPKKMWIGIV